MNKSDYYELKKKATDYIDMKLKRLSPMLHGMWRAQRKNQYYRKVVRLINLLYQDKDLIKIIRSKAELTAQEKRTLEKYNNRLLKYCACRVAMDKLDGGDGWSWYLKESRDNLCRSILEEILAYPLETSRYVINLFRSVKGAVHRGDRSNQFVYIPGIRPDRALLVAHADTVWDSPSATPRQNVFVNDGDIYRSAGLVPRRGLGADDRAGCAILWALNNLGHSLLITDGEERGRLGSRFLMEDPSNRDIAEEINEGHSFAVQFDRRNAADFKCYDVGTDEFRSYVAKMTGYTEPDRSTYTDITTICRRIPGVNLSIGYYQEHTLDEYLVTREWQHTVDVAREWLSQPLPTFLLPEVA
jgi:hypothetical protein